MSLALPVIAAIPLLLIGGGIDMRDAMHVTLSVGAAGYIAGYILVCAAAPVFLRRIGELTPGPAVVAGLAATALTAALVAFFIDDTEGGGAGLAVVGVLTAVFVAAIVLRRRHGPGSIGAYDEPVAAQVLGGVPSPGRARDA